MFATSVLKWMGLMIWCCYWKCANGAKLPLVFNVSKPTYSRVPVDRLRFNTTMLARTQIDLDGHAEDVINVTLGRQEDRKRETKNANDLVSVHQNSKGDDDKGGDKR